MSSVVSFMSLNLATIVTTPIVMSTLASRHSAPICVERNASRDPNLTEGFSHLTSVGSPV